MRAAIGLVLGTALVTTPFKLALAQAVQRDAFTVHRTEVADNTSRKLIGASPTTDITEQLGAAEGSSMLVSVVTAGAAGAVAGGMAGFLVGGLMNIGADIESFGSEGKTRGPCSTKNCAQIGAVIGAAAGFALGAAFGAVSAKRRPSNGRANVRMVPLYDGRLGIGASVRF